MAVVDLTYISFCFLKLKWGQYSAVVRISSCGSHIGRSCVGLVVYIDALGRAHAFVEVLIWVWNALSSKFDFIGIDQAPSASDGLVS